MRTRRDVEVEMDAVVADARSAATDGDWLTYEIDHDRLNALLLEHEHIPQQRKATP